MLTVREVAALIKVSDSTVRRWIRDGSLNAYKVGKRGQLRIREEDLELFLESQRVGAHTANNRFQEPQQ